MSLKVIIIITDNPSIGQKKLHKKKMTTAPKINYKYHQTLKEAPDDDIQHFSRTIKFFFLQTWNSQIRKELHSRFGSF